MVFAKQRVCKAALRLQLQDVQRVFNDDTNVVVVFVTASYLVVAGVAVNRATQAEGQVFGRAFLQYVFALEVEFVLSAFATGGADVVTFHVAGHEAQTWYAIGCHVQVVTSLPRTLIFAVKVGVLHGVGEENGTAAVYAVVVTVVTGGALMSDGELVSAAKLQILLSTLPASSWPWLDVL